MKKNTKIVALIPMRHHSERVSGKNYRDFAGKPLYHHIVNTILKSSKISEVVIDTDSDLIKKDCSKHFPSVILLDRPEHLRADTVPMNDVLLNVVSQVVADFYFQTHSTNPLLTTVSVDKAIKTFIEHYPNYDSLFSVTKVHKRLWDKNCNPINHDPDILLRTQDLENMYEENSCIYIFPREIMIIRKNRIGIKPFLLPINEFETIDIDEEFDFIFAEALMKKRQHQLKSKE